MAFGFHIAEPNEALLVSGRKGKEVEGAAESMRFKIVTGDRVFVWPIIQSVRALKLDLRKAEVPVECYTKQGIPVRILGVVAHKVGADYPSIANAAQRFLEDPNSMDERVHDLFAGHVRAIVGGLTVEELIRERDALTAAAREATSQDMEQMGLVIDSLQIADIGDPTGYIEKMAAPELSAVARNARIAQADTNREASEKEAEQAALVAQAQRQSEIVQAEAQAEVDKAKAEADQAGPLAAAEAQKAVVQKQTEVAQLTAQRSEKELDYQVRLPAQAQRDSRIFAAEAEAGEKERIGAAEAEAQKARGLADAAVIKAKGESEGAALEARARGLEANQEAVISQQIAERLPDIVAAAARIYDNVDSVTILDGSDGLQRAITSIMEIAGSSLQTAREQFKATDEHRARMQGNTEGEEAFPVH